MPVCLFVLFLLAPLTAVAQTTAPTPQGQSHEGVIVSTSKATLLIQTATGEFKLFEINANTTKPEKLPVGATVTVSVVEVVDRELPAIVVVKVTAPPVAGAKPPSEDNIPPSMRRMEGAMKRQVSKFRLGVRAGAALAPEQVMVGVHSQFGPLFSDNLFARPNLEFSFGEVTDIFSVNLEGIYRIPQSRQGKWAFYFGGGIAFNFVKEGFTDTEDDFSFDDFNYETGLNILAGIQSGSMFLELKTSVYAPPTVKFIIGYSF